MFNMNMLSKLKKMQDEMEKKLKEFNQKEFDFNYKNSISLKLKGSLEILSINIDNQLVDPEDKVMLEEMVAEAVNEAISKVLSDKDKLTESLTPKMPFGKMPF